MKRSWTNGPCFKTLTCFVLVLPIVLMMSVVPRKLDNTQRANQHKSGELKGLNSLSVGRWEERDQSGNNTCCTHLLSLYTWISMPVYNEIFTSFIFSHLEQIPNQRQVLKVLIKLIVMNTGLLRMGCHKLKGQVFILCVCESMVCHCFRFVPKFLCSGNSHLTKIASRCLVTWSQICLERSHQKPCITIKKLIKSSVSKTLY